MNVAHFMLPTITYSILGYKGVREVQGIFFHVVKTMYINSTRISKSFDVVSKHRSDQFHWGKP